MSNENTANKGVGSMAGSPMDFMTREAYGFDEWLLIGNPRTEQRIRSCLKRFPRNEAIEAITRACVANEP